MGEDTTRQQAADIFRRAATYIRRYGWQEKGMSIDGRPRCSMGALASAHPVTQWDGELSALMHNALYQELPGISLTQFNHRMGNGEAVAQLFERIAATL